MKTTLFYLFFSLSVFLPGICLPAYYDTLEYRQIEDSIDYFVGRINKIENKESKLLVNDSLLSFLYSILQEEETMSFDFPSVKKMGFIESPDTLLRIVSWNLNFEDGTNRYFAIIQYRDIEQGEFRVFPLSGNRKPGKGIEQDKVYNADNWYGCLYYEIIPVIRKNKTYYTLLGIDLNDLFTKIKVVDVLSFDAKGPVFGEKLFLTKNKVQERLLFEYSASVSMTLRYDKHLKMIIMDHLSPKEEKYKGNYEYYGPDFSYDGLEYRELFWYLKEDIDVRIR